MNLESTTVREATIATAFDAAASSYDYDFDVYPATRRLRNKVYEVVRTVLSPKSSILDINCGTGTDAIELARLEFRVSGLDLSPKMIEVARTKASKEPNLPVSFHVGSYNAIPKALVGQFDMLISDFGGLNCTADLHGVAEQISSVLKHTGYVLAVVMPPFSLWETSTFLLRGSPLKAFRRMNSARRDFTINNARFEISYHRFPVLARIVSDAFAVKDVIGFNIVSPPPRSQRFRRKYPRITRFLESVDDLIERLPVLRTVGDHYLVLLKRRTV